MDGVDVRRYRALMRNAAIRLAVLVTLLFMPFGMTTAASAAPAPSHERHAMAMQHCPHQEPRHQADVGFAACTMVCSAALPAGELASTEETKPAPRQSFALVTDRLHGILPEIATPPPRQA